MSRIGHGRGQTGPKLRQPIGECPLLGDACPHLMMEDSLSESGRQQGIARSRYLMASRRHHNGGLMNKTRRGGAY